MPAKNDWEFNLQRLAAENGRWAEEELRLIKATREHKRRLKELPTIIRKLRGELEHVTAEMARTGAEYDALEAEMKTDADERAFVREYYGEGSSYQTKRDWADDQADVDDTELRAWANAQTDELTDWRETCRRPNY